ncbi:uncharacterized protein LOC142181304 [Nicotiana tabacum]|uniref:Uncharacterized protein LOC142181304 n=1 Tax=Nicotiana tabacum TaxID=4097 RepID=A0AC58ULP7_TOBAC
MTTEKIDHTHPLFVHPSNTPSFVLVPVQLTGSENYEIWLRSVRIALQAKRKLGFITGTYNKDQFRPELHEDCETFWEDLKERFDKVNRMTIFQLHREIATISQGTDSISMYFTKLKELRAEYDAMVPSTSLKEYADYLQRQRLLQFLSGLNDSYAQARRHILMKSVEPALNQAYALVVEDETQRNTS